MKTSGNLAKATESASGRAGLPTPACKLPSTFRSDRVHVFETASTQCVALDNGTTAPEPWFPRPRLGDAASVHDC